MRRYKTCKKETDCRWPEFDRWPKPFTEEKVC
jgi:hypothetical protein